MNNKAPNDQWWRGGVIYQIYPRSFQDSNGDGIGDLPGITQRLDYVADLGVDGIWLSPFFTSPMKDFGYDISDYCGVDPIFGSLEDFRVLVERAHDLGLKVMIDQVLSHSSDQHPWFIESRKSRDNPKADWYVWADPKRDGTPPNNWISLFGGSAWQWDTHRQQYYMHNFLSSQPDLNFHNLQVQEALLQTVHFWLELGVDGYRLDTVNFYTHDQQLRDNPARGKPQSTDPAVNSANPYAWQWHHFDKSQPENLDFLRKLRCLLDNYANTTMVGEIGDDDGLARLAEYTQGQDKLHMAYCFDLLGAQHDAPFLHAILQRFLQLAGSDSWPCWSISNHDVTRVVTRWGMGSDIRRRMPVYAAMQLSLLGSHCIYQGDELGLVEAQLDFTDLQDPYGIAMWPQYKGRDGCRTPMVWDGMQTNGGFSTSTPWLPVCKQHLPVAVAQQIREPNSVLAFYRHFLHWRRQQPALHSGGMRFLGEAHKQLLIFEREGQSQRIRCVFNLSDTATHYACDASWQLLNSGLQGVQKVATGLALPAWSGAFLGE